MAFGTFFDETALCYPATVAECQRAYPGEPQARRSSPMNLVDRKTPLSVASRLIRCSGIR